MAQRKMKLCTTHETETCCMHNSCLTYYIYCDNIYNVFLVQLFRVIHSFCQGNIVSTYQSHFSSKVEETSL